MRHIIMKLPGEKKPEFIFMTPFTPRGKDNLAAWMVARMDGENYGKLSVYRFPRQSLVYGPRQIANRINQDTDISRELTLWDQRGSQVIKGELLVIPIEEALVYVQPIYLKGQGGQLPELKRVVVAFQDHVVMSETFESSLARLFNGEINTQTQTASAAADTSSKSPSAAAPSATVQPQGPNSDLIREADDHYQRALSAQRSGDWATYGDEIKRLGE